MAKYLKIAEIGQAHDGSLGILHSFIDALANCGIDAIKFQTHYAEAESSVYEPFRTNFSYEDATRYDYWDRMSFSPDHWKDIGQHCSDCGLEFMSSPFSLKAVDVLEQSGVSRYKIGSGEVSNHLLLERTAQTGKPIILSSGLSSFNELDEAVHLVESFGNDLSILQCTTSYPTPPQNWGLNLIPEIKERYKLPTGYSDHSGNIYACMSAANWGAEIFEFHATYDKRMFGPDSKSSLEIDEIKLLAEGLDQIMIAMNSPIEKTINSEVAELKSIFEKSLAVNRDLKKGETLSIGDLETKKPANMGIPAKDFRKVVGKRIIRNIAQWEFLKLEFLEEN